MVTQRENSGKLTCFLQKVANGVGTTIDVSAYSRIVVVLCAEDATGVGGTVKIQGSQMPSTTTTLAFGSTASLTNLWDYVSSYDSIEGITCIAGSTGYAFTGAGVKQIIVNTNNIQSLNVELSGFTAGLFSAFVYGSTGV